ncbi:protein farnesyltransferase subunit beta [Nilaparvata lugens]|uniref:protein farnesyltransferase subunit beta n=1 Tax=Nilaparvata lugens TaxID=108931 RepID=UPI00193EAC33|nr:protein farnesyltransferase subunit beta [Nilaparvata lugens]
MDSQQSNLFDELDKISSEFKLESMDEEGVRTHTSSEQIKVEIVIKSLFNFFLKKAEIDPEAPVLHRELHLSYLKQSLCYLPSHFAYMDASRTWLCYWITHSMELLDFKLPADDKSHIARFLAKCQGPDGGFGGGPGQFGHLAPTYAAVNTLCTLGTEEAYKAIDRKKLLEFLWSVRQPNGSFGMHVGGEIDVRGVYCAVSVARLTNIYSDALFDNSAEWIISCQTYEGGFSGSPGHEAHGGYAFCALAALCLLYKEHLCDIKSLLRWTVNRQMRLEGGFQGRTNKLVDGCYSFWQAGAMPLIQGILAKNGTDEPVMNEVDNWLFNSRALQEYILIYCQTPNGGLIDKPGKSRDLYHTCYTLSGLSIAQHQPSNTPTIVGTPRNLLKTVHPTFNIESEKLQSASLYFSQLPSDFL